MRPFLKPLFWFLYLTSTVFASSATDASEKEAPANRLTLQELLAHSDERSVHAALHLLSDKFRDGIFSTDSSAVEAIHSEDAPLATRVLKLARRQGDGNSSIASTPPTSTSVPTSLPASTNAPQTTTANNNNPTTSAASSSSEPIPSTSQPPASSASSSSSSSEPSSSSLPSVTAITTTAGSSATSVPSTLATSQSSATSTSASAPSTQPGTTTTSTSASAIPFTSTLLSTITGPNGSLSTITSLTVWTSTQGPPTGNLGSSPSSTPGLISGASPTRGLTLEILAVLGGAVVVAVVL